MRRLPAGGRRAIRRARAALVYDDESKRLVLPFKHGDRTDMARACGRWMARAGGELLAEAELIAPVPLHWRRLFTPPLQPGAPAGAGGGARTARPSSRPTCCVAPAGPARRPGSGPRSGAATCARAFALHPRWRQTVKGKAVLLVDDVLTTGRHGRCLHAGPAACRRPAR